MPLILSCEHASGGVPARFAQALSSQSARQALASHRGVDLGALPLARDLARRLGAPLLEGRQTRLLIDLNRSRGHRSLFSEWSRTLPERDREQLQLLHDAHFAALTRLVAAGRGRTTHVAVHSFTPVLSGKPRPFDVGLLYDPARPSEVRLAQRLRAALLSRGLSVRRNAPYRGIADGASTCLRRQFSAARYTGLELEVNQGFLWHAPDRVKRRALLDALIDALAPLAGAVSRPRRATSR